MKVAVSIPDAVFSKADDLAKRLKASRSEIYSRALGEFLGRHSPDRVTEAMNDTVAPPPTRFRGLQSIDPTNL